MAKGIGTVLPPGSFPAVASLPSGKIMVKVVAVAGENDGIPGAESENLMAQCVYPDGFIKNHHANSPADLFGKIVNQLRGRYGVTGEIKAIRLPDELAADTAIEVEV